DLRVTISWIPGHLGVEGNERADEEAKRAAQGRSSPHSRLPRQLHRQLPQSQTAAIRTFRRQLEEHHDKIWKKSPRYAHFSAIDPSSATIASRRFWKLARDLLRK
ncbi:hypothetical protein F5051DRAFT_306630, partial [Lentinula edodes]